MGVSIAAGEYLDSDTGTFVTRRGRRETLEFKGLWSGTATNIVMYRSPLSQAGLSLALIILIALAVVFSAVFQETIVTIPFVFHGRPLEAVIPLLGLIPLCAFVVLARRLLNYRYILTADSVSEVKGLVGVRLVWSQLDYKEIREVVVYQDPIQQFFDIGDIQLGSDVNEEEIVLRGIHNPLRIKLIIRERMNARRPAREEPQRKAANTW
jgi:hypothetical protein